MQFTVVPPSYKVIPSVLKKWPYKRGYLSCGGGSIVLYFYLSESEIWSDKKGKAFIARDLVTMVQCRKFKKKKFCRKLQKRTYNCMHCI